MESKILYQTDFGEGDGPLGPALYDYGCYYMCLYATAALEYNDWFDKATVLSMAQKHIDCGWLTESFYVKDPQSILQDWLDAGEWRHSGVPTSPHIAVFYGTAPSGQDAVTDKICEVQPQQTTFTHFCREDYDPWEGGVYGGSLNNGEYEFVSGRYFSVSAPQASSNESAETNELSLGEIAQLLTSALPEQTAPSLSYKITSQWGQCAQLLEGYPNLDSLAMEKSLAKLLRLLLQFYLQVGGRNE